MAGVGAHLARVGNPRRRVFDDPFRFDLERRPNEHVAFGGGGAHYRLGRTWPVSRGSIFAEVLSRMPDLSRRDRPRCCGRTSSAGSSTCRSASPRVRANAG